MLQKSLSLAEFKKRFGFSIGQVRRLVEDGQVKLEQNGYVGDSPNHHKNVVYPVSFAILRGNALELAELRKGLKTIREFIRLAENSIEQDMTTDQLTAKNSINDALDGLRREARKMEKLLG